MKPTQSLRMGALALLLLQGLQVQANSVWDEAVNGDLSNDGLAPTLLTLALGSNQLAGTVGNAGLGVDRDYFSFNVPAGADWTALLVNEGTQVSGSVSFMAVQAGPQVTVSPSGAGASALLGFTHYEGADIGNNVLPRLLSITPGLGGTLAAGTYSMWVQETGGTAPYNFSLVLTAVPEPATAWLAGIGLLGWASRRLFVRG